MVQWHKICTSKIEKCSFNSRKLVQSSRNIPTKSTFTATCQITCESAVDANLARHRFTQQDCLLSLMCCVRSVFKKMSDVQVRLMLVGGGFGSDAWRNLLGRGGGGCRKLRYHDSITFRRGMQCATCKQVVRIWCNACLVCFSCFSIGPHPCTKVVVNVADDVWEDGENNSAEEIGNTTEAGQEAWCHRDVSKVSNGGAKWQASGLETGSIVAVS